VSVVIPPGKISLGGTEAHAHHSTKRGSFFAFTWAEIKHRQRGSKK